MLSRYRWALWLLVLLSGCTFPRTQTIIELRADRVVETQATEVRVEVRDSNGTITFERVVPLAFSDARGFPLEFPVSARRGNESLSFEIRATASVTRRDNDGNVVISMLAQNRLRSSFRRGQVLRFPLWLLSGCRCNFESERCEPDADGDLVPECRPQTIDVTQTEDAGIDAANDGAVACVTSQRLCGGQCVSLNSPVACGPSCARCPTLPGGDAVCDNDMCDIRCAVNTPDRCGASCVNLDSDPSHCGRCGNACASGQLCTNRQCAAPRQCTVVQDPVCTGPTYCNLTTLMCASGCDGRAGQCAPNQSCNVATHVCACAAGSMMCGSGCAACPSGPTITTTGCLADACVVTACANGYRANTLGTACDDIDECATNNGGCGTRTCANTAGSFSCVGFDPFDPTNSCGTGVVATNRVPGTLLVVFDSSGSMGATVDGTSSTRWRLACTAMREALTALPDNLNVGLLRFPSAACSLPSAPTVAIGPLSTTRSQISTSLSPSMTPLETNQTPLAQALDRAYDILGAHTSGQRRGVLLVTDGAQTCVDSAAQRGSLLTMITQAAAMNAGQQIRTFVVGLQIQNGFLSQLSQAGGSAPAGCNGACAEYQQTPCEVGLLPGLLDCADSSRTCDLTSGLCQCARDSDCGSGLRCTSGTCIPTNGNATCCNYTIGSTNFQSEFQRAIEEVSRGFLGECTFEVPRNPNTTFDPALFNVGVTFTGQPRVVLPNTSDSNVSGWHYTNNANQTFEITGPVCEQLRRSPATVEVVLGCMSVVP